MAKLTKSERKVLQVLADHEDGKIGHLPACGLMFNGSLGEATGLSFDSVVFSRLAKRNLLIEQPYEITAAGRTALAVVPDSRGTLPARSPEKRS